MGYAVIMFGILLIVSVVVITAYNYGVAKDSQIVPLKAENIYAERETGKAQTAITIVYTCLSDDPGDRYLQPPNNNLISGPHTLNLVVKNNGSIVLNPNNVTVLYNASHIKSTTTNWEDRWNPHWDGDGRYDMDEACEDNNKATNVWTPLSYVCKKTPQQILIPTPNNSSDSPALGLLVTAENGISTIAPTSPINFTGSFSSNSFKFSWNASYDEDGIASYRLYGIKNAGNIGDCKEQHYDTFKEIPGNSTSVSCDSCPDEWFYLTAVDTLQNEGVQSRTLKCNAGLGCING